MTVNFNGVIRMMGVLLAVLSCCMLPSMAVALIYQEMQPLLCFLATSIPCLLAGIIIIKVYRPSGMKLKARDGYLIVSLCWLVASLVGAVPFVLSGAIPNYVDAFFETCSGFSTTGSSILTDIESLPKSMLFWRSFTHWIGGMGIIVFAVALLPSIGVRGQIIAGAETPGPTLQKINARFSDMARNLYLVYLLFTVVETILLCAGGLSLYDALVHTFGTVGTGGFSSYADSIAHFTSPFVQWVIIIFMMLCGINFNLYFVLARHGIKTMFKDAELRFYIYIIGAFSVLILLNLFNYGVYDNLGKAITDVVFQVVSVITTTGYATADFDIWPTFSKILIFLILVTGACSSSTGGGVKLIRILVALKMIRRGVSRKLHPSRYLGVKVDGKDLQQDVATNISNYIFFYLFVVFVASVLISFNGFDIVTTISSVLTCVGNVGPGFNLVGPSMNFSIFSGFSKAVLALLMIAGRLELFTMFMLLSPHYWNSNKA